MGKARRNHAHTTAAAGFRSTSSTPDSKVGETAVNRDGKTASGRVPDPNGGNITDSRCSLWSGGWKMWFGGGALGFWWGVLSLRSWPCSTPKEPPEWSGCVHGLSPVPLPSPSPTYSPPPLTIAYETLVRLDPRQRVCYFGVEGLLPVLPCDISTLQRLDCKRPSMGTPVLKGLLRRVYVRGVSSLESGARSADSVRPASSLGPVYVGRWWWRRGHLLVETQRRCRRDRFSGCRVLAVG